MTDLHLPPPLPPPGPDASSSPGPHRNTRAGDLAPQWRIALFATWTMVFLSYMAVWKASEELGIGTWWLGPRSNPQPIFVSMIPFAIVVLVGLATSLDIRYMPWISIGGSFALVLVAIPDLSRSSGLATVEFAIAGAALVVSLASLTGTYRNEPEVPAETGR